MGFAVTPLQSLTVEVFQGRERASREIRFAYIPNGPFDTPFLVSRAYLARAWSKMIMSAQLQDLGVKVNIIVTTLDNDTAKVVVNQNPGKALPIFESMDVTAKEAFHPLVEEKLKVQRPRVR